MLEAAWWGFAGGAALIVGAAIALLLPISQRAIGLVLGFGAGVLISAVAFELTIEAFDRGGRDATALGLAAGALAFFLGDTWVDNRGGEHRMRADERMGEGASLGIVLGAALDGVPESVALGVTLLEGEGVSGAFLAAVFLSNLPEGLGASTGLRMAGRSSRYILRLWLGVAVLSAVAAGLGYAFLDGAPDDVVAWFQAFAAGAILTLLADLMLPEAAEKGGKVVGLLTVLGFALSFFLSQL
jgi:zinc transporter, ZIP family